MVFSLNHCKQWTQLCLSHAVIHTLSITTLSTRCASGIREANFPCSEMTVTIIKGCHLCFQHFPFSWASFCPQASWLPTSTHMHYWWPTGCLAWGQFVQSSFVNCKRSSLCLEAGRKWPTEASDLVPRIFIWLNASGIRGILGTLLLGN